VHFHLLAISRVLSRLFSIVCFVLDRFTFIGLPFISHLLNEMQRKIGCLKLATADFFRRFLGPFYPRMSASFSDRTLLLLWSLHVRISTSHTASGKTSRPLPLLRPRNLNRWFQRLVIGIATRASTRSEEIAEHAFPGVLALVVGTGRYLFYFGNTFPDLKSLRSPWILYSLVSV